MLSTRIKSLRNDRGWSQDDLARKAGVSQQLIGKIENGRVLESRKLPKIAGAFGITVDELLAGIGAPVARTTRQPVSNDWPFPFSVEIWNRVPVKKRRTLVRMVVAALEDEFLSPTKPTAAASRGRRVAGSKKF